MGQSQVMEGCTSALARKMTKMEMETGGVVNEPADMTPGRSRSWWTGGTVMHSSEVQEGR